MAKSIPKEFRLTFKEQVDYVRAADGSYAKDSDGELIKIATPPLGFAIVYEPHVKTYDKRKRTQDDWAYGSWFEQDGKIWTKESRWTNSKHSYVTVQVEEHLQPKIIVNEPLDGYTIAHSVSRYSTSNKLWRILDPRGFELEINTGTMEDLIMGGTITNGKIIGTCIWETPKRLVRV